MMKMHESQRVEDVGKEKLQWSKEWELRQEGREGGKVDRLRPHGEEEFKELSKSPQAGCVIQVVQLLSHVQLFVTPWTAARQASLSKFCPRVCSNSCLLSQWCHPTISSSTETAKNKMEVVLGEGHWLRKSNLLETRGRVGSLIRRSYNLGTWNSKLGALGGREKDGECHEYNTT